MCYPIILEVIKRCHIDKNISVIFALSSFFYVLKIKGQGTFCCLVCKLVHVCLFTLFNYESCKFIPSHIFLNYKSIWSDKKVWIIGNCQWRVQVTYRGQRYNLPPFGLCYFWAHDVSKRHFELIYFLILYHRNKLYTELFIFHQWKSFLHAL